MSKNIIFYFSQTGNSLAAAKQIANVLENTKLISIAQAVENKQFAYEDVRKVGFVFPIYCGNMPITMQTFLKELSLPSDCYCFAIATRLWSPSCAFSMIDNALAKRNLKLSFTGYLNLPDSYIRILNGPTEKAMQKKISHANQKLSHMIAYIAKEETKLVHTAKFVRNIALKSYNGWKAKLPQLGKELQVSESCNGCGICTKICPANNIHLENGVPCFGSNCEDCVGCIQHCPQKAIYVNDKTIQKRRYLHPAVKLDEFFIR